ncbi:FAD-binding oxidoreductase [Herbiconiux solani]|uniref:FAD-binding oxidoreductase n=1 Tax=Herbiconiux solani TaxID=661329 RepID=UPI000824FCA6|nr:FAD-binding oxidoreductase [Herbiconiux solani]
MSITHDPTTALTDRQFGELAASIGGAVLRPGDAGYGQARTGYNLAAIRDPDVVVRAADSDDVAAAVAFAAREDLPVAVISTGHHATRPIHGGMLIVTEALRQIVIDPVGRRAQLGAGVAWGDVLEASLPFGLAPLHGSSPLVGVVGFSLGGGISPTMGRAHGWAADHVTALRVVVGDGTEREVSATDDPDLFWAIRGGRSNVGVVTAIEVELFPVADFVGGGIFFDGQHARAVLEAYRALTDGAPDALTTSIALLRMPPLPGVPQILAGEFRIHLRVAYQGPAAEADALLAPIRAAAPVLFDTVAKMPYADFASIHSDPVDPAPFTERTAMLETLDTEVIDALLAEVGPKADPGVEIVELRQLGGALARIPENPGPVDNRDAAFVLWAVVVGPPPVRTDGIRDADALIAAVSGWSTGRQYLNFAPDGEDSSPTALYPADALARLRAIKGRVDPQNLFRLQQPLV